MHHAIALNPKGEKVSIPNSQGELNHSLRKAVDFMVDNPNIDAAHVNTQNVFWGFRNVYSLVRVAGELTIRRKP
jgi:hypothetical protein